MPALAGGRMLVNLRHMVIMLCEAVARGQGRPARLAGAAHRLPLGRAGGSARPPVVMKLTAQHDAASSSKARAWPPPPKCVAQ